MDWGRYNFSLSIYYYNNCLPVGNWRASRRLDFALPIQ